MSDTVLAPNNGIARNEATIALRHCGDASVPYGLLNTLIGLERSAAAKAKRQLSTKVADLLERTAAGKLSEKDVPAEVVLHTAADVWKTETLVLESLELLKFLPFANTKIELPHDPNRPVVVIEGRNG